MNFALSETWTYQLLLVPIPPGIHSATQLYPGPNSLRHCSSWQGQTQFGSDPRCKTVLLFVSNCSNLFETKNLFEILFSTSTALGFSSLDWMNSPNEMDLPLSIEGFSWWAILEVMEELCNSGSQVRSSNWSNSPRWGQFKSLHASHDQLYSTRDVSLVGWYFTPSVTLFPSQSPICQISLKT